MKSRFNALIRDTPGHRRPSLLRLPLVVLALLVVGIFGRNVLFIRGGLLDPNFTLIHEAYRFNLVHLPLGLFAIAGVFVVLAVCSTDWRRPAVLTVVLCGIAAASISALRIYMTEIEPTRLEVRKISLRTPKLSKAVTVLHLSDIQSGAIGDYERKIFKTVEKLEPDLIIYTGDFVQAVAPATFESEFPKLIELFASVTPPLGIYAAFGDTELEIYRLPSSAIEPVEMLSSRSVEIEADGGALSLLGLSLYQSRNPDWALRSVEPWLEEADGGAFTILFGHAPEFATKIENLNIDLSLAGHTHGGQIRIPIFGPLITDSAIPREWSRGFRRIGIPFLNVSAGAGSNRFGGLPPLRLNCPTEMTLLTLEPMRTVR